MKYNIETNSGLRSHHVDAMEKQLIRQGLHTSRLDPTHKFENKKLKHYNKQCPLCRVHFSSKLLRCPKCDVIVSGKRPTGTDSEQKEFMQEYASVMDKLEIQRRKILQHNRDIVKDSHKI